MTSPHVDSSVKEKMNDLAHQLYAAIEGGDREQILTAQKALSAAVEALWERIDHSELTPKDKAVARLLAGAAVKDLPEKIQDPVNYPQILHELRLLKNSLVLLD
jgi:hypothetical protein